MKILKRISIVLILIVMILEFVFPSNSFASEDLKWEKVINSLNSLVSGVASIIFIKWRFEFVAIGTQINTIITAIAQSGGTTDGSTIFFITPYDIFFNKLRIVDINFFDLNVPNDSITYKLRSAISKWYYTIRLIAISMLLVVLIYIGIRMLLASTSEDKAKYKKMFVDWAVSLVLVYVLQYIAMAAIAGNSAIVSALKNIQASPDYKNMIREVALEGVIGVGMPGITSAIIFVIIIIQTIGFLIAYFNRLIKTAFLLIISPFIAVTYSIDKVGDGKSQALNNWLKEFVYTILIQPFHCIIYLTFMSVTLSLLKGGLVWKNWGVDVIKTAWNSNPFSTSLLAIISMLFVGEAEKIVRKIFGFKDNNSKTSLTAGLATTVLAVKKAGDLGKGVRSAGNFISAHSDKLSKVKNELANTKVGQKVSSATSKIGQKVSDTTSRIGKKVSESKIGKGAAKIKGKGKKLISGAKGKVNKLTGSKFWNSKAAKFMRKMNPTDKVLGSFAGIAMLAAGKDLSTAIGVGSGISKSTKDFLNSSSSTIGKETSNAEKAKKDILQKELDGVDKELADAEKELEGTQPELDSIKSELDGVNEELESSNDKVSKSNKELSSTDAEIKKCKNFIKNSENPRSEIEKRKKRLEKLEEKRKGLFEKNKKLKEERAEILERKKGIQEKSSEIAENRSEIQEKIDTLRNLRNSIIDEMEVSTSEASMKMMFEDILAKGDKEVYEKSSGECTLLINEIENELNKVGESGRTKDLIADIEKNIEINSGSIDIQQMINECIANGNLNAEIEHAVSNFAKYKLEALQYKNLKFSQSMNLDLDAAVKRAYEYMN